MGFKAIRLYLKTLTIITSLVVLLFVTIVPRLNFASATHFNAIQFIAVFTPVVLAINLLLFLVFAIRLKWWIIIPILTFLINIPTVKTYFGFNFFNSKETSNKTLKLSTYNVNYFTYQNETVNVSKVARFAKLNNIDIFAIQEFETNSYYNEKEILDEFDFMPYSSAQLVDFKENGLIIFSKFPIIRSKTINFPGTNNGCVWADVLFDGDTVRVLNNHLQTTGVSKSVKEGLIPLYKRAKDNFKKRAVQVNEVRKFIDTSRYPIIVCGDFNDTPKSYAYYKLKGNNLQDSFIEAGKGPGGTFLSKLLMNRIDYVLHSGEFNTLIFNILSTDLSDHKPLIVEMEYRN